MSKALDKQEGGSHYKDCKIQPVEFIVANDISYREANVIKYVTRHASKNGADDIKKAIHYLEMILEDYYEPDNITVAGFQFDVDNHPEPMSLKLSGTATVEKGISLETQMFDARQRTKGSDLSISIFNDKLLVETDDSAYYFENYDEFDQWYTYEYSQDRLSPEDITKIKVKDLLRGTPYFFGWVDCDNMIFIGTLEGDSTFKFHGYDEVKQWANAL